MPAFPGWEPREMSANLARLIRNIERSIRVPTSTPLGSHTRTQPNRKQGITAQASLPSSFFGAAGFGASFFSGSFLGGAAFAFPLEFNASEFEGSSPLDTSPVKIRICGPWSWLEWDILSCLSKSPLLKRKGGGGFLYPIKGKMEP